MMTVPLDPFKGAQELAGLAKQEIYDLTHGDDTDLAVDVLGLLTAAAGPLSLRDLVALRSNGQGAPAAAETRHVRRLVEERAARGLERVSPAGKRGRAGSALLRRRLTRINMVTAHIG